MPFKIEDKVALVTGGASGIGFCCVKELLRTGAKGIAFIDANSEKGQEALDEVTKEFGARRCIFIQCDITQPERFDGAFELTVKTFKQLDIVINNAGIFNEINWQKCIDINLTSCIHGTKLALEKYLPQHKGDKEGVIVNVSSMFGLDGYYACPVYCATKHGVVGLSRSYGTKQHYSSTHVKVIAVCPGFTITQFFPIKDEVQLKVGLSSRSEEEEEEEEIIKQTPEHVAKEVVKIITEGDNGSVWVVNGQAAYEP